MPSIPTKGICLVAQKAKNPFVNAGDLGSIPGSGRSWRMEWQPTPVFLSGKSHWQRSQAGCSPWGRKSRTQLIHETTTTIPSEIPILPFNCQPWRLHFHFFSFRSYISTLILGKPENNYNDLWPLGYERLVLRGPQVHTPGFHPLWCCPAVSVELSDSPVWRFYHFFPVEVKIPP